MFLRRGNYFLLVVSLSRLPSISAYAQEPLAIITSSNGRIFISTKDGQTWEYPTKPIIGLYEGQSIQTDSNASATILYFSNGKAFQLGALQRHVIQASAPKKEPRKRTRLDALRALRLPKRLPQGSRKGLGEPPVLLCPRAGRILSDKPTFAWLSSGPDSVYWIKLFLDEGVSCKLTGTLLWQKTWQDTVLKFPEEMKVLHAGQKYWIEIGRSSHEEAEDYGCFTIASVKESKDVQKLQKAIQEQYESDNPDDVTAAVVRAAYLIEEKFYAAAYEMLKQTLQEQPYNVTAQTLLDHLYERIDLPESTTSQPE